MVHWIQSIEAIPVAAIVEAGQTPGLKGVRSFGRGFSLLPSRGHPAPLGAEGIGSQRRHTFWELVASDEEIGLAVYDHAGPLHAALHHTS
jgi:hypothetical protein